jgi:hypothetical protein
MQHYSSSPAVPTMFSSRGDPSPRLLCIRPAKRPSRGVSTTPQVLLRFHAALIAGRWFVTSTLDHSLGTRLASGLSWSFARSDPPPGSWPCRATGAPTERPSPCTLRPGIKDRERTEEGAVADGGPRQLPAPAEAPRPRRGGRQPPASAHRASQLEQRTGRAQGEMLGALALGMSSSLRRRRSKRSWWSVQSVAG